LIVDTNERPHIDRDHQLTAHGFEAHRHKAWWIVAGIALLLLLVLALVLWRHHEDSTKKAAPAPPKITITTATAKKGDIGVYLDAIGTVTPVYTDSITSQVAGLIIAVHYKEGQVVKKGDPLVDIDSRAYRANLLQAQGALKRDQNVLEQAQMDLERYRVAWSHNGIASKFWMTMLKRILALVIFLCFAGTVIGQKALSAKGGFESSAFTKWLSWPSRFWSVGASLPETIFEAGLRRATVQQFVATYNADLAAYRQTCWPHFSRWKTLSPKYASCPRRFNKSSRRWIPRNSSSSLNKGRYDSGIDPYIDVLIAQTTLLADQQTLNGLQVQRMSFAVALVENLGGWDRSQLSNPPQVTRRPPKSESTIEQ
jgi:uncharacterized integral membrane protein